MEINIPKAVNKLLIGLGLYTSLHIGTLKKKTTKDDDIFKNKDRLITNNIALLRINLV